MNDNSFAPGFSIVICCHNSAEVIIPTLEAVAKLHIPESLSWEIILVDNNCTDNTVELASRVCEEKKLRCTIEYETEPGLVHARKKGVEHACFQYLIFLDDDNIVARDWLGKAFSIFSAHSNVGAVGGNIKPLVTYEHPSWFRRFQGIYACGPQGKRSGIVTRSRKMLVGAGLAMRPSIVKSIFSSHLPLFLVGRTKNTLLRGDDSEICMRCVLMGWDLWYEASMELAHNILKKRVSWEYLTEVRRGRGSAEIILLLYQDLIEGRRPRSYHQLSKTISERWKQFWENSPNLAETRREGSETSFFYEFMVGMTDGFFSIGETDYELIRKKLVDTYNPLNARSRFIGIK